jgi:rhodanese-related sulfurtransferase
MATSVKQMLEAANAAVPKITTEQAIDMIAKGNTLILDVRDAPEVAATGKIATALNVSRGMLEFRADPESPYHDKNFDNSKTIILYCASGGRSALTCLASITHRKRPCKYVNGHKIFDGRRSAHAQRRVRTAAEKLLSGHVPEASFGNFVKGLI